MIPRELIPDTCRVLYRIHRQNIRNNKPVPGAFREQGKGEDRSMSTDWGKYSNAKETQLRARDPKNNAVVSFIVGALRGITLEVIHSPDPIRNNPAHTDVKGISEDKDHKEEIRLKLLYMYKWEIKLD